MWFDGGLECSIRTVPIFAASLRVSVAALALLVQRRPRETCGAGGRIVHCKRYANGVIDERKIWSGTTGRVSDKATHSAFNSGDFRDVAGRSGAEVLVLSAWRPTCACWGRALDAIDEGFYVVMVSDAVASSVPESDPATLESFVPRFDEQAVVATTAEVLSAWQCRTGGDRDGH